ALLLCIDAEDQAATSCDAVTFDESGEASGSRGMQLDTLRIHASLEVKLGAPERECEGADAAVTLRHDVPNHTIDAAVAADAQTRGRHTQRGIAHRQRNRQL